MKVKQLAAQAGFLSFTSGKVLFGQRDAQLRSNGTNGFGERRVLDLLHEAEDVTREAASEAVIELFRGVHAEAGRLLVVERTEPGEILRAGFLQLDVVADDANDV